jgi:hypothetical protein
MYYIQKNTSNGGGECPLRTPPLKYALIICIAELDTIEANLPGIVIYNVNHSCYSYMHDTTGVH